MSAAAILNHPQALTGKVVPLAASSQPGDSSSSASGNSATITANDFLTLLVTEMQNQDPTANTDPNEYINQLVQVNSLEQLIGINQTLTAALGTDGSSTAPSTQSDARTVAPAAPAAASAPVAHVLSGALPAAPRAFGNLSAPTANPAAQRVAHALDGSQAAHVAVPAAIQR